jgi:hypothetical protein
MNVRRYADAIKLGVSGCAIWGLLTFVVVARNRAASQDDWSRYSPVPYPVGAETVRKQRLEANSSDRDCRNYNFDRKINRRCVEGGNQTQVTP